MNTLELAKQLAELRGQHTIEQASHALEAYLSGKSTQLASRASGVPDKRIMRWVEKLGIKREKAATRELQRTLARRTASATASSAC
jgi:hypothetical protein